MMTSIFSHVASDHGDPSLTMPNRLLVEENNKLKEQVSEGKRKIQNLVKQLNRASADVAKSVQSVAEYNVLDAKLSKCTQERDAARSELVLAQKEKDDMSALIAKLQEQAKETEKIHKYEMETSNEKNDALKSLLETVSAQATELTDGKLAVESQLQKSRQRVEALQDDLDETNRCYEDLHEDWKLVLAEKKEMSHKIDVLGANIQANEQHRRQIENKSATLAYELKKSNMEYGKLLTRKESLAATVNEQTKTIQAQRDAMQQKDDENTRLASKLDMVSHSHDMALSEIDALKANLNNTVKSMEQQGAEAKETQEKLEAEVTQLSEQKENLESQLKLTRENLEASRVEVSNLKSSVADREQQIEEEKQKLAELGDAGKVQVLNGLGKISFSESYF